MNIFALGDLHLSGNPPTKPMTVFGEHWQEHPNKIFEAWQKTVTANDLVIICGDTSWAMQLEDAFVDLDEIANLPGHKVILRGNHDYWWASLKKMQAAFEDKFFFLQNNFYRIDDIAICGTRGWILPGCDGFKDDDISILTRETLRLEMSLESAVNAGFSKIIVAMHYPPIYTFEQNSPFRDLIDKYKVSHCVFGHIHEPKNDSVFEGVLNNCNYKLVSCDTQNFELYKLI